MKTAAAEFSSVLSHGNAKWVGVVGDMAAKALTLTDELCGWYWASINICPALEWQVISSLIRFQRQRWLWLLVHVSPSLTLHVIIAFDGFCCVLVFYFEFSQTACSINSTHLVYLFITSLNKKYIYNLISSYFGLDLARRRPCDHVAVFEVSLDPHVHISMTFMLA